MRTLFAFPLTFLLGVLVMACLRLLQVNASSMTLFFVGGLSLLLVLDHWAGRAGNSAILRGFAKFTTNAKEARAHIDTAEDESAKTAVPTRVLQIAGFATGATVCLIWSPSEIIDWLGGRPFF